LTEPESDHRTDAWEVLTDDAREREWFATLATTLAQPSRPAGPDNRLRHVVRLSAGNERAYFLKTFAATQPKNRLRFRLTRPTAGSDAERELRVTQALRAAGIAAPRPVAWGRRGPASFYLCAELPGTPLTAALATPSQHPGLARAAARFCGQLLGAGFRLPDLAPDHVFSPSGSAAAAAGEPGTFGVLDLHNGGIGRPGPADRRLLRRVLRRFARSCRGTPAAAPVIALPFAVRLIRAAGRNDARAVLAALPPLWTARRYERAGKSAAYATRNPRRQEREAALLRRVWPGQRGESVLDLPCGAARLLPWLRDELGHEVTLGDGALAMLQQARAAHATDRLLLSDALAVPLRDGAVDGVVQFRFLHHLPPDASKRAIAECCRVARRFVVVSFFHPCSAHHLRRQLRRLTGEPPTRFARTLGAVTREFERAGFRRHRVAADRPYARDLWLASFVRR